MADEAQAAGGTAVPAPLPPSAGNGAGPPATERSRPADSRAVGPLSLGLFEVQLPPCADDLAPAAHTFCVEASRAVRAAYEDDNDDPSVLLALSNAIEVRPELGTSGQAWQAPIGHALARSEGLQRLGPTLRLLRKSMADAYLDRVSNIYRGVNTEACRAAFAQMPADEPHWMEMVVTVEPLGTYPLSRLHRFCTDSRTLSLKERRLPGTKANVTITGLLRKLWQQERLNQERGVAEQVNVTRGWHVSAGANEEVLEVALRAELCPTNVRWQQSGDARCSVQRVQLARRDPKAAVHLRYVHNDGPIACHKTHPHFRRPVGA